MNPFFPPYSSILVDLTDRNLQFPDSEDEVHNKDNSCDYGDNPEGDASLNKIQTIFNPFERGTCNITSESL